MELLDGGTAGFDLIDFIQHSERGICAYKGLKFWERITTNIDLYFAASDIFILPGIGGLAINNALIWGKPTIVSSADGTEKDLIYQNKTGYYFTEGNVDSLIAAIESATINLSDFKKGKEKYCISIIREKSNINLMVSTFKNQIDYLLG